MSRNSRNNPSRKTPLRRMEVQKFFTFAIQLSMDTSEKIPSEPFSDI